MLEVREVEKSYNRNKVLKGVSLNVQRGEIHGLIGENSAGKTTLLKCVTGIYRTDHGSVLYDGKEVFDNPEVKERIGYVADYNEYISYYTVSRMVHMYENFYPSFQKDKFNSYNQIFQLPVGKRVFSLSKGQKMRLAFMLEVSKNPEYLILDEPTSGLDPVAKARFLEFLINEVEQNEIGVLISSHNLGGLEKICDTVTMMRQGQVERQMTMEGLKSELVQLNVIFEGGAGKAVYDLPQILKMHNVGSIYTMVVRDYDESFAETLRKLGASLIEPADISLEELFVVLEEEKEKDQGMHWDPKKKVGGGRCMKGFKRMTREYRWFYLSALIIVLLLMLSDTAYLISEKNSAYDGRIFGYHMERDSQETFRKKNAVELQDGRDYAYVVSEKIHNFEPFGLIPLLLIVTLILNAKQKMFGGRTSAEFQVVLPVKQNVRILHDYLSVLGILLAASVGQMLLLLAHQTAYNRSLLKAANALSVTVGSGEIALHANQRFLLSMGFYILFLVMLYTWIYFGMLLARNPVLGSICAVGAWQILYWVFDEVYWQLYWKLQTFDIPDEKYQNIEVWADRVTCMMSPYDFYEQDGGAIYALEFFDSQQAPAILAACMGGFVLLLLAGILLVGGRRELSNGKLFYFSWLDYPFSLLCGLIIAIFMWEATDWDGLNEYVYLLFGFVIAVGICLWIHPRSDRRKNVWEVK